MTPKRTHYRTLELSEITGMTLRRLQWLDEQGIVRPGHRGAASGTGYLRHYSIVEAVEVSVIAELRKKGLSLRMVAGMKKQMHHAVVKAFGGADPVLLIALPSVAVTAESHKEVISIACKSNKPIVLVDIVEHFKLFV